MFVRFLLHAIFSLRKRPAIRSRRTIDERFSGHCRHPATPTCKYLSLPFITLATCLDTLDLTHLSRNQERPKPPDRGSHFAIYPMGSQGINRVGAIASCSDFVPLLPPPLKITSAPSDRDISIDAPVQYHYQPDHIPSKSQTAITQVLSESGGIPGSDRGLNGHTHSR